MWGLLPGGACALYSLNPSLDIRESSAAGPSVVSSLSSGQVGYPHYEATWEPESEVNHLPGKRPVEV
jgi:hypothetical protein